MEIERKFLVKGDFRPEVFRSIRMVQAYLNSDPSRTVRVRISGESAAITVKGPGSESGMSRFEWEKPISPDEAAALLELAEPGAVDKTRHHIHNTDCIHTWEVDEFHGDNEGLVVAEIELSSEDETFDRPGWLGEEVTGDPRYYNSALSRNPYRNWKNDA